MIRFAPLVIPLKRRIETLCVFWWLVSMPAFLTVAGICATTPYLLILFIPYYLWALYDNRAWRGGSPIAAVKKMSFWKYFRDYFPAEVVLVEPLDPNNTYLFACHPHGIAFLGVWANFLSDATGMSQVLKGIKYRVCTLVLNFYLPLWREWVLALGGVSVDKKSCDYLLSHGYSPVIVIGGATESLDAHPKTNRIIIRRRKGFIKLAIAHGAHLVPVFTFGENEVFRPWNMGRPSVRKFQVLIQKYTSVAFPLWNGRGIFNYDYGPLPYRHRLVTVIGKPLPVEKKETITDQDIEEVQNRYIEALISLFNQYNDSYGNGSKLEIYM